jgi:hypothetical protein
LRRTFGSRAAQGQDRRVREGCPERERQQERHGVVQAAEDQERRHDDRGGERLFHEAQV